MIRRESAWGEVEKGDYVLGKGDVAWKVVGTEPLGMTHLTDRHGYKKSVPTPAPATSVTKMTPTQDEAIAVVQKVLGGTVLHDTH